MIEFGYTLRKAREAKGLTTKDIAQTTHMMVQMVEDLENENFAKIAAPIYGRGFVKLYCEAVGIEAKPLVNEFMEIYNGNRPATIRMREPAPAPVSAPVPPPAAPQPAPAPVPPAVPVEPTPAPAPQAVPVEPVPVQATVPQPEPVPAEPTPFSFAEPEPMEEPVAAEPPPAPVFPEPIPEPVAPEPTPVIAPEPPKPADDNLFSFKYDPAEVIPKPAAPTPTVHPMAEEPEPEKSPFRGPSRYAAPMPIDEEPKAPAFHLDIPPAVWRLLVVVLGAFLILWLLFAGVRALYRATMTDPTASAQTSAETTQPTPAAVETRNEKKPAAKEVQKTPGAPTAPRTPRKVEPLYID